MIKVNVNGGRVRLEANGALGDILADTCRMINAVYTILLRTNPGIAEVYKSVMQGAVLSLIHI